MPDASTIQQFAAALRGRLIQPDAADYDAARSVYNAMIDRRPALIAYCADVADVIAAVGFAREHGLPLAVRGGGHSGPGLGVCDDGVVVDLSAMKGVRVDPTACTARVEGGCVWGDVDHATHVFGLATPSGFISTTGVGGLTLGGGIGYLSRHYGLTIDNLIGVDVVLADGRFVTANAQENSDLFWAVRGGGGNFGVVTSFEYRLHPVNTVFGGPMLWPMDRAAELLKSWRDFILTAPVDINGWFGFMTVPPAAPFPEKFQLQKMCAIIWCYSGPPEQTEERFAPIRAFGAPAIDFTSRVPFPALQSLFDVFFPPGLHWYWKADFFKDLRDEAIALHVEHGAKLPTAQSTMHLYPINGAVQKVGKNDTAFSFRDANFAQVIVGVDPDAANCPRMIEWARDYWQAMHPLSAGGGYVNMIMDEGQDVVRAAYRDNYDRLLAVKNRYDPQNLFRINQNIQPGTDPHPQHPAGD
jgi:FAD/FMN-containing dehydrogenase